MELVEMKKPFKFRYVNEIVGAMVLLVLAVLMAGIIIAGRAQGWFEPVYEVRASFGEEGVMGLRRGSEVRIQDTPAGMIADIIPTGDGSMEAIIRIRGRFAQYVRDDSTGVVRRAFAVAGDSFVEVTVGRGAELTEVPRFIPIIRDTEITQIAESLLEEVRAVTVPAIQQLQLALEEYTGLAADLRDPEGPVQELLNSVNGIVKGLEAGEGPAGKLLRDQAMAEEIEGAVRRVNELLDQVNVIMTTVAEATAPLPRMVDRIAGELEDAPGLVYQTQATLQEVEALLNGLQRHWLLRRYMEKDLRSPDLRVDPSVLVGAGGVAP